MKKLMLRLMATACAMLVLMSIPLNCMATSAAGAVTAPAGTTYGEAVVNQMIASILSGSGIEFKSASGLLMVADEIRKKHEYYMEHPEEMNASYLEQMESFRNFFGISNLTPGEIRVMWEDASASMRLTKDFWQAFVGDYVQENTSIGDDLSLEGGLSWNTALSLIPDFQAIGYFGGSESIEGRMQFKRASVENVIVFRDYQGGNFHLDTLYLDADVPLSNGVHIYCTPVLDLCQLDHPTRVTVAYGSSFYEPRFWLTSHGAWLDSGVVVASTCDIYDFDGKLVFSKTAGYIGSVPYTGSVALPAPDSLVKFPSLPKEHADGSITYAPDLPLAPEDALVKNPPGVADIPFDKVIDAVTGKDIVDTADPSDPDKPSEPDQPEEGEELPGSGDLSLPGLISTKFPFSIPFDIYRMLALLASDPVEPVFKIPLKIGNLVNESITMDFSQFSGLIEIVRWGEYVLFVFGLASVTRNYIKW